MDDATKGPDGSERRRDPRHDTTVPARLRLVGLTVDGHLVNVSARGVCFVTADPHLRVAASNFVNIDFTLPTDDGDRPVTRQVRVTRVETLPQADVEGARRRLGLEWDEPLLLDALRR